MSKPMPVVTCIGVHPSVLAAALTKALCGQDEMGVPGAIAGIPIRVVKCKTINLEVPEDSENRNRRGGPPSKFKIGNGRVFW